MAKARQQAGEREGVHTGRGACGGGRGGAERGGLWERMCTGGGGEHTSCLVKKAPGACGALTGSICNMPYGVAANILLFAALSQHGKGPLARCTASSRQQRKKERVVTAAQHAHPPPEPHQSTHHSIITIPAATPPPSATRAQAPPSPTTAPSFAAR